MYRLFCFFCILYLYRILGGNYVLATILTLNFNYVNATSDNTFRNESTQNTTTENEDYEENEIVNETSNSGLSTLSPSSVTSVSTVNSYEQANLQLNNILCIILIAIGVLIILFAIAILIRLKK